MEYIIGAFAVLLCLFLIGYFMKRNLFKEVDRYEAWKIDIMNRPVLDEMSKVKQLNMTGQTEQMFERWRRDWDEIVTSKLPHIEDYLFDAEDYIDKYRFNKAKDSLYQIEQKLVEIEEKIKKILSELNELVGSEEKNRAEIEGLKEIYRESKKTLLAHRHNYGQAEKKLEQQLDEVVARFQEFDEKTENGNYLEAREIVLTIKGQLDKIASSMELIPSLLLECQTSIPAQINVLKDGLREMEGQGYVVDHLDIENSLKNIELELETYLQLLYKTEVQEADEGTRQIKERIDNLMDLLEKEFEAKQYINENQLPVKNLLETAEGEAKKLKAETETVQESYHLSEKDLGIQREIDQHLNKLAKRFELLSARVSEADTAQSLLSEELQEIKKQLASLQEEQRSFSDKLSALRKDEMSARDKVGELTKKAGEMIRLVAKSNLPGMAQDYKYLLDDAKESIQNVSEKLQQKPLDIPVVQQYLEIAVLTVEKLENTTIETIENVVLAEKTIQYGNRYRSKYPSVAKGLQEAEQSFRSYDYRLALEQAATSIEEIEPGALKKIEKMLNEG
ncbi:septation ring formation regulator EzrA [Bacillus sp. T33-2]|uniref:septation ring formation regulator EzrA n=1 Tax=Bacillus sp. T33-2 TaxID=2054168 RepID=UPI000C78ADE9|nr:septation ring formation regulator EzrA [Bacillus sp. T33-2]PLR98155.1 septation ring formation regulator EzrA [Bacillus sp. T33-2]